MPRAARKLSPIKEAPAPSVELRPLDSLTAYENNARTHGRDQIDQLKSSIMEFGWTNPILADEDGIVGGHARSQAARELYEEGAALRFANGAPIPRGHVPVVDCTGWSEAQRKAYILADNAIALNAGWDAGKLKIEFGDLAAVKFDVALTGFTPLAIQNFTGAAVDDPQNEWQGMPEFEQGDKTAFKSMTVHFADQAAVDAFAELVGQTITEKTRSIWFPKAEIETYADKRYAADDEEAAA